MDDIEKALLAQDDQLERIDKSISDRNKVLDETRQDQQTQSEQLDELDYQMTGLFGMLGLDKENLNHEETIESNNPSELTDEEKDTLKKKRKLIIEPVPLIQVSDDWEAYGKNIDHYIEKYQLDTSSDPLMQLLSAEEFKSIKIKYVENFGDVRWNKWDYTIVGLASLVGFLVDLLVVKLPAGAAEKYAPVNKQSEVGKWVNDLFEMYLHPDNNKAIKSLENWAKTPYDAVNISSFDRIVPEQGKTKMTANLHRLKTPGHDPVLQLIFGVLDSMNGTISVFDQTGNLAVLNNPNFKGTNLFLSITKVLAHFISDIGTTRGVVPPFFSATQAITAGTPWKINDRGTERSMTLNELGERMYSYGGYNFNHFLTMSLTPLSVEMMIRSYRWMTKPSTTIDFKHDYKLQSMLTMAHSLTMSTNIMKMWMSGWNPLAFNYSQLLMLVKAFYSYFRAEAAHNKLVEKTLMKNWQEIYTGV